MNPSESKTNNITKNKIGKTESKTHFLPDDGDDLGFYDEVTDGLIQNQHSEHYLLSLDESHTEEYYDWLKDRKEDTESYTPADPDASPKIIYQKRSHLQSHMLDGLPHCDYKPGERIRLAQERYQFVNYRSKIYPINGKPPYYLDTVKCKKWTI